MKGFHIEAIEHSYRAVELFKTTCPVAESVRGSQRRSGLVAARAQGATS